MKRLHDLKPPPPTRILIWYSAMQTRRGARHLISVPAYALDPARMTPPFNVRYQPRAAEQWRRGIANTNRDVCIPNGITPEAADSWRACHRAQAARSWNYPETVTAQRRQRGYCERCWDMADAQVRQRQQRFIGASVMAQYNGDDAVWRTAVERALYER